MQAQDKHAELVAVLAAEYGSVGPVPVDIITSCGQAATELESHASTIQTSTSLHVVGVTGP